MPSKTLKRLLSFVLGTATLAASVAAVAAKPAPLVIQEQGSFAAGGHVVTAPGSFDPRKPTEPAGHTCHGDHHAYAFYQIPVNARKYPIVVWHGAGQFSKAASSRGDPAIVKRMTERQLNI